MSRRRTATLTYDAFRERTFFPVLDGIRAIAVLAVVAFHVGESDALRSLQGGRGVWWFFALSGFLITTLGLREEDRRGGLAIGPFFIRRAFRIVPLYLLALVAFVVADVVVFQNVELTDSWAKYWPYYLTFLQDVPFNLGWDSVPFQVAWSLGVEEKFYLVWPILGFVVLRRSRRTELTIGLSAMWAAAVVIWSESDMSRLLTPYLPILLGCVAAMLLHERSIFDRIAARSSAGVTAVLGLLVAVPWPDWLASNRAYPAIYGALVAAAVAAFAVRSRVPVLDAAPALWVGKRSYAIYLLHVLAIRVVSKGVEGSSLDGEAAGAVIFVVALVAVLALADLLHRSVERPLIRVGRRLSARAADGTRPLVIEPTGGLN